MARMLEALEVAPGDRVLEIATGTGTGYNAALLCERLGSEQVTTVDIDASLVEAASERLRMAGYIPTVAVTDGADGYPAGAPHDRRIGGRKLPPSGRRLHGDDRQLAEAALACAGRTRQSTR